MTKTPVDQVCSRLARALFDEDDRAVGDALTELEQLPSNDCQQAINEHIPDDTETLLHAATREVHVGAVRRLIALGAQVNVVDEDGNTPLANALTANCSKDVEAVALELIDSGANCIGYDRYDLTPLHHAAATGSKQVLQKLIDAGADVMALDRCGWNRTPLHEAAADGNSEAVPLLVAAGAAPDQVTASGDTDLLLAVKFGHRETAAELIHAGCNVNHADPKGRTPLHFTTRNGDSELTRHLVAAGASLHALDHLGQSPLRVLAAFEDVSVLDEGIHIEPPEPLDEADRLAIFITLLLQNWSGAEDYVDSSFISVLHEKHLWLVSRCKRLREAVIGLAKNRSYRSNLPRSLARICHDIFSYVIVVGASHRSVNDSFAIANLDDDMIDEEIGNFELAFIRFFSGDHGFPAELTVDGILQQEMDIRR